MRCPFCKKWFKERYVCESWRTGRKFFGAGGWAKANYLRHRYACLTRYITMNGQYYYTEKCSFGRDGYVGTLSWTDRSLNYFVTKSIASKGPRVAYPSGWVLMSRWGMGSLRNVQDAGQAVAYWQKKGLHPELCEAILRQMEDEKNDS